MSKLLKSMLLGLTILAAQPAQAFYATAVQVMGTAAQVVGVGTGVFGVLVVSNPLFKVLKMCYSPEYALREHAEYLQTNPSSTLTLTGFKEGLGVMAILGSGTAAVGAGLYKLGSLAKKKSTEKEVTKTTGASA